MVAAAVALVPILGGLWLIRRWPARPIPCDGAWWRWRPQPRSDGAHDGIGPEVPTATRRPTAQAPTGGPGLTEEDVVFFGIALQATDDVIAELLADWG